MDISRVSNYLECVINSNPPLPFPFAVSKPEDPFDEGPGG
jgi:hypothetical protein